MARLATGAIDTAMLGSILSRVRAQAAAGPLTVFDPMLKLCELARRIGTAITHEIGAVG